VRERAYLSFSSCLEVPVAKDILSGIDLIRADNACSADASCSEKSNAEPKQNPRVLAFRPFLSLSVLFVQERLSIAKCSAAGWKGMKKIKEKRNQPALSAACKSGTLRRANSAVPVTSRYLIVRGALSLPPSHPPLPSFKHELPGIASRRVKIALSHATLCVPLCVSASRVKRTYARVAQVSTLDASRELSSSIEITGPDPVGTIVDTVRVYRPRGLNGEEANQESALPYQCFPARAIASLARGSIVKPPRNQQIASREILQCGHGARCRL